MFDLRPADGALVSTQQYVRTCFREFRGLAREVLSRIGMVPEDGGASPVTNDSD
jgi:chromosome partitioning protein